MNFLVLFVLGAASGRATRLLIDDAILDAPRAWVLPRLPFFIQELATCPWCLSMWISAGVVGWFWIAHTLAMPLLMLGAVWWVACATYWLGQLMATKATEGTPLTVHAVPADPPPNPGQFWAGNP